MIYTSENNWYSWQYGNEPLFGQQPNHKVFKTHFSKCTYTIGSFGDELKRAAASTLDYFPNLRPSILFSGGIDSEIVLRTYIDIGANPDVFIIRYEDDANIGDVSFAVAVCSSLGIKYNLIDFNLKKFYENDAEAVSEISQVDYPRALPQMKFIDYIQDGLPILCTGDPSWHRTHNNYSIKGNWIYVCNEFDIGWSKYVRQLNRPAIGEWFMWTPGILVSHSRLEWFKKLINDEYYGKLGVKSTKLLGYREVYPDLWTRKKMTGFENINSTIDNIIKEFEQFLEGKYNGLPYRNIVRRTLEDIEHEIVGS